MPTTNKCGPAHRSRTANIDCTLTRSEGMRACLDVCRDPLMVLYGCFVLERQVQVPDKQHHQTNGQRH